jgi:glycosyltransferase involved in cell wall biosynthesis
MCGSPAGSRAGGRAALFDAAKVARLKRILFVFSRASSFIAIDQAVLEQRWRVRPWRQQGAVVNLPRLVREVARSDLVFGWFASWHTFLPVVLARIMRKPAVVVIGGFDTARLPDIGYGLQQRGLMRHVSRWVMRHATHLITNSHYSRDEAAANAGVDPERVTVVYHGVPDPFGDLPEEGKRAPVALTVGFVDRRNLERKGLRPFVDAAAHLPGVSFVVAGRWEDAAADELREHAAPNVTLTGWVEQEVLNRQMQDASVYVQASAHEGFGMSVAEAMLAGCIPVTTRAGALPEVVDEIGVQVDDADPQRLAAAIARAMEMDDATRARARRRILDCFGLDVRERGLHAVVAKALGES